MSVQSVGMTSKQLSRADTAVVVGTSYQYSNHDRKLISVFEVIVAYFVGVLFNDIYMIARSSLSKKSDGSSLTDVYKARIQAFVIGAKNDESCYRDLITNLHKYFAVYYSATSFPQFVDRVTSQVIPDEYFDQLANTERDEVLSSTVCDLVSGLASFVTTPDMLQRIIDNHEHQWKVTQRMIQDHGITILLAKRETFHNQFLRKIGQANGSVPVGLLDDLKKALRRIVREKMIEKMRADNLAKEVRRFREREAKYAKLIALLKTGNASGPSAALHDHYMPRPDRLAEVGDPLDVGSHSSKIPPEDTLAESRPDRRRDRHRRSRRSDSDSGRSGSDEDYSDESDEDEDEEDEDDEYESDDRRSRHDRHSDRHDSRDRRSHGDRRKHRDRRDRRADHRSADPPDKTKRGAGSTAIVVAGPGSTTSSISRDVAAATATMSAGTATTLTQRADNIEDDSVPTDDGEPVSLLTSVKKK